MLVYQDLEDIDIPPPAVIASPIVNIPATTTHKAADALETTPTKVDSSEPVSEMDEGFDYGYGAVSSHPFRTFFFALVLLGVPSAAFVWCGGMNYLRRTFRGKGKYRRVGDEDLEK